MNKELEKVLKIDYNYAVEAQSADEASARVARDANEMARYFDLSLYIQLADLCWALERWEDARHWYRHNAHVMMQKRAWNTEHSSPDYPIDATSDWEASTFIKAGDLEAGQVYLKKAITYWQNKAGNSLVLTELGLYAAQVGLADLTPHALEIISARQELPGGHGHAAREARELLHYEPAQVNLLLGRWDAFLEEAKKLDKAIRLVEDKPGSAFPVPMQAALVAACRGLQALASLYSGKGEPKASQQLARQAFESAMLNFYQFSGQIDWNLYFMRLNTRFADELAIGQPLNLNPFAGD